MMPDVIPVELTALGPAVVAVIWALRHARLPDRWTPLVAIALGVAGAEAIATVTPIGWVTAAIAGISIGASATGLHQAFKQALPPPGERAGDV